MATAARAVGTHWGIWLRTAVVLQLLAALVAGPTIALLLRAALRAAGVGALTEASVGQVVRHPVALIVLLALTVVATVTVLVQHAAFVLLARELRSGRLPRIRDLASAGLAAARRLAGPQLGLVALYSFLLVPLGGFTVGASLSRGIELPPFIAGELQKTPLGTTAWLVGLLAGFVSVALVTLAAPDRGELPGPPPSVPAVQRAALPAAIVVAAITIAAVANTAALTRLGTAPRTAVVAHRGATYGAVENTLESLEAAAALGADVVELDVLQAGDGGLVVVHDTNLRRIAGVNRNVWEMTTAELAATTVRQGGREATLPTFEQFAERAAELGVPLLVELKAHGHEHGDFVGDVVAVLEKNGLVEESLVQAFDARTVEEIEARVPEVTTGWVVAFSRGRLDVGAADFVTMEQTSYSRAVLQQAHASGVQVFLWTVTDPVLMRAFMRDGVDGLITGYPSRALEQREAVAAETGMAGRLEDTLRALVDW